MLVSEFLPLSTCLQTETAAPDSMGKSTDSASPASVVEKGQSEGTGASVTEAPSGSGSLTPQSRKSDQPPSTAATQKSPTVIPPSQTPQSHPPPSLVSLSTSPKDPSPSNGVARGESVPVGSPGSNGSEEDKQEEEEEEEEGGTRGGKEAEASEKQTPG